MKVNSRKLQAIMFTHCIVNIKVDGQVLKYRYKRDPNNPKFQVWFCNDKNTGMQVTALIKHLVETYKEIEVTYKRQF